MEERRGVHKQGLLCSGPGRLCQALGLTGRQNGLALTQLPFELRHRADARDGPTIVAGPRIGITKAIERPWRFGWKDSKFLSKKF
jgi:DNA-3-methyladenine glycosylase